MVNKRKVLGLFSRDFLMEIADEYGIEVEDRRSKDSAIEAVAGSKRATLDVILPRLSRDVLKGICRSFGYDDGGREKDALVTRLLTARPSEADDPEFFRRTVVSKRDVVELLSRDELLSVVNAENIECADRRVLENLVDAVVRAKRVRLPRILQDLSRDRLKSLCEELQLDSSGREKQILIDRLAGETEQPEPDAPDVPDALAPTTLRELLGQRLRVVEMSKGWPLLGELLVNASPVPVAIYCRMIGGSARGNLLERRFQNPSQKSRIVDDPLRTELLLGIWTEQGPERSVLVAFDAARRYEKQTRFSLFMPLALLEQAADTGFATHETASGEELIAFRPERLDAFFAHRQVTTDLPGPRGEAQPAGENAMNSQTIGIRPKVGMYSAFARLNYKPWFALAEFVDNSIQSYLANLDKLEEAGRGGPLLVDISVEDHELTITDRAGGIAGSEFGRAFSPAEPPANATGLSEFGLGMKAAACWFANAWQVRTSALGEDCERTINFDIPKITQEGLERLPVVVAPARATDHFTVITLKELRAPLRGRTLGKVKEHLRSIYREFLKSGQVRIRVTTAGITEELSYMVPDLLHAPFYRKPGDPIHWRREFDFEIDGKKIFGWAGILKKGSYATAGFSIIRRGRVVEGSHGDKYKPTEIFGSPNSFVSQRLIGEIFVEGFEVSHTKDGLQWGGGEDEVIDRIRSNLRSGDTPLLEQAEGFRARTEAADLPLDFGSKAMARSGGDLAQLRPSEIETVPLDGDDANLSPVGSDLTLASTQSEVKIVEGNVEWTILLELLRDGGPHLFATHINSEGSKTEIKLSLNLDHEFSVQHLNVNDQCIEPVVKLLAAYAVSEMLLRNSGVKQVSTMRHQFNAVLRAVKPSPVKVPQ